MRRQTPVSKESLSDLLIDKRVDVLFPPLDFLLAASSVVAGSALGRFEVMFCCTISQQLFVLTPKRYLYSYTRDYHVIDGK